VPALALAPAAAGPASTSAPIARPAPSTASGFAAALESRLPRPTPPAPPRPESPPALALRAVEAAQARLDAVLAAARSGRTFTAAELLGLQADAYRLAQTLDVAGKLVEQGVQGVKQAVQTQV
jgi:hypothetical protein